MTDFEASSYILLTIWIAHYSCYILVFFQTMTGRMKQASHAIHSQTTTTTSLSDLTFVACWLWSKQMTCLL